MSMKTSRRRRCRHHRHNIISGGRRCCRLVTTTFTALITITILHHQVHAYNQNDELSYLTNFNTLTSNSHSELSSLSIEEKSWLTANCINQGKLASSSTAALLEEEVIVVASPLSLSTVTSSQVQLQCNPSTHCIIPQSLTLVMNSNLNVGGLTLDGGQLSWTDETSNLNKYSLCAGFVIVQQSSSLFHMKLLHASSRGIIYIKNNGAAPPSSGGMNNNMMGTRVFGTDNGGNTNIEGSTDMKRTWTLLRDSFGVGASMISVIHNVASMGWKVGDRIGIAPTTHASDGTGQTFTIASIIGNHTIQLSHPNQLDQVHEATFIHGGGANNHLNGNEGAPPILKSAEVINLSRNIIITGDDFENVPCDANITSNEETSSMGCKCSTTRTTCTLGLHTIHHSSHHGEGGGSSTAGSMKISGARVEKCGQRGIEGKYCLHFHLAKDCPSCVFENNAIEFGHHRGITVHGSHRTTVRGNVLWDVRGANVYIEDGNEMHNEISYNVAVCPHSLSDPILQGCSVPGTSNAGSDAPNAAFYSKAATNDWIGNRAANTYNGMLLDAGTRGQASGQVCASDAAMGRWVGNTMHGCSRFGLYTLGHGGNFPKVTDRSIATNGLNQNTQLCEGFDSSESTNPGTTERGYPAAFYQNVDYHNVFVGHYMAGDLQHRAHSSINNNNLIYWKETKNFADGCSSHFFDSFYQDGNLALPDQGSIILSRTKFGQNVHLEFNHHCDVGTTGVLCMPQYIFDNSVWENDNPSKWISFQAGYNNDGGVLSVAPGQEELPNGFFPDGFYSVAGSAFSYLLSSPGPRKCIDSTPLYGNRYDSGILCNAPLRSFKIYSRGLTESTAPVLKIEVWFNSLGLLGQNGPANAVQLVGFHVINDWNVKQGYSFPIMTGLSQSYRISLFDQNEGTTYEIPLDWVIEFSDPVIGNRFGVDDEVYVNLLGRSCGTNGDGLITSQHDRKFLWSGDHFIDDAAWGNHGACTESANMSPVDCSALVGGNPSEEGSIEPSECPELCAASPCNPTNSYCHCGMPSTCKCKPGFNGPDCSIDVCSSASCGEHGSCAAKYLGGLGDVAIDPSFECICESGWFGSKCDVNPCELGESAKICSGNGKCFSLNGIDAACDCEHGYHGNDCEIHNIAYGKFSSTSSEQSSQPSSRAFDGNGGSRWESVHDVDDVYLEVDLGDVYDIESVNIHWEASSAKRYDIEVSSDGTTFTSVWSKTDGYANMGSVISTVNGVSGRFVRMHAYERTMPYGYSIFEMEVFGAMGPSSPPTPWPTYKAISLAPTVSKVPTRSPVTSTPSVSRFELAREKTSSASSENLLGTAAALAFDGNPGTRWESAHGVENVWLQVDLGNVFLVSEVKISWEFACAKKYDIELSTDGVSFTSVWSKVDGFGGMGLIDSVFIGANARFVRMQAFERATQWGYSIWEMEVYGSISSGPTPTPHSSSPTKLPSLPPTTAAPTSFPTSGPSSNPTLQPSPQPTAQPSPSPTTAQPSSPPTPEPTLQPSLPPTTAAPTANPPEPTALPTPQISETVFKYVCTKNAPLSPTICADGTIAGGACSTENDNNACGNGGKVCYWAECPAGTPPPPAPTPPAPTPRNCLPLGTSCGQNSDCCSGNCPTKGKNPYQCEL